MSSIQPGSRSRLRERGVRGAGERGRFGGTVMNGMTMLVAGWMACVGTLPPDVVPMKDRAIQIPIVLNRPQQIRELLLFVSNDQGRTWQQVAVARPDQQYFPFTAREDGLYWFQVVTIDHRNEREPSDLNQLKPALAILVDTQPPLLRITSAEKLAEEVAVTWQLQEANPEIESLRLEHRPAGDPAAAWVPVQITPMVAGQARFRPAFPGPIQVRMTVQDVAGNMGQASQTIGMVGVNPMQVANAPVPPPTPVADPVLPNEPVLPPPPVRAAESAPFQPPSRELQPAYRPEPSPPVAASRPDPSPTGITPVATNSPASSSQLPRPELRNTQLINSTQISLEYEVPRVGPSGLRSVRLYMTRDDGRSWEELADDPDLQSPIQANLPGEGLYGFRLVVESGAGLSKGMPMPGDAPELRVEVDLTPPYLELFAPLPDPKERETLVLRWSATDKNLAPSPIMLEWATNKNGPWVPITPQPIANSGSYTWKLNQRLPYRVYLRVTARDLAGNIGEVISPEPQLIDLTKPEGHLIGIKSASVPIKP